MTITAVGFDLDYTLAVPDRDRGAILSDAVAAVGAPPITREAYVEAHRRNLTGETRTPIFEELLRARAPDDRDGADERARKLTRTYREAVNEALVPIAGVEPMLSELRTRYRTALLTNGPTIAQREKISTLGWGDLFDGVVITGELTAGKPDPAAFEALLDVLGSEPATTAYVGDEVEADVGGAAAAGLSVVQVEYPGGPAPDDRADVHLDRTRLTDELPSVLESL